MSVADEMANRGRLASLDGDLEALVGSLANSLSSTRTEDNDTLVTTVAQIAHVDRPTAQFFLEANSWSPDAAIYHLIQHRESDFDDDGTRFGGETTALNRAIEAMAHARLSLAEDMATEEPVAAADERVLTYDDFLPREERGQPPETVFRNVDDRKMRGSSDDGDEEEMDEDTADEAE